MQSRHLSGLEISSFVSKMKKASTAWSAMTLIYNDLDIMNKLWLRNHDSLETKDNLG